jgi:heat shock protein HslJ
VSSPELPDDAASVPADEMQKVTADPEAYLEAKAEELNALPTSAWEPDLATLDEVVASLEIEEMPVSGLTDKVWWWMGSTAGSGSDEFTPLDDPSLYQVQYSSSDSGPSSGIIEYIADCNSGNMAYELHKGGLVGGMLAQPGPMTLAECGPESRYQEFVGGLQASQDYRVRPNGKTMVLVMPADGPQLLFVDSGRTAPAKEAQEVRPTPVPEATAPPATPTPTPVPTAPPSAEISFTADSTSIQQGECTTVRWKVENVKTVHVYPQGEPYDKYPATGEDSQEVCPESTTTYELRVELKTGEILLQQVTVQVQSQGPQDPLKNTSWVLSSMYVNQVPVPDTTITLAFGAEGDLSGDASCNTYNGSYTVNGNLFSVGPLATTRKSCGEDVDAQEQAYLTALQSAATFEISGNQLIIYDAGRQEVLRFNAAG